MISQNNLFSRRVTRPLKRFAYPLLSVSLFVFYVRTASSFFVVLYLGLIFLLQVELEKSEFVEKNYLIINYFLRREPVHLVLNRCSFTFLLKVIKIPKK